MRSYFACVPAVAMVLLVFACTETKVNVVRVDADVPEGGTELEDGAVVGEDGEVITKPDTAKPSVVDYSTINVTVNGNSRQYYVAVPKAYAMSKQYPLVLVVHGDGGNGPGMQSYHPLDDETGADAIVAYPSGNSNTWDLSTPFDQNEDQQYVEAVIASAKSKYSIDAARVFGVGWSSGGFLMSQLACRRAGIFRGIVIHAGGAPFELPANEQKDADGYLLCPNSPKVATLVTHGASDGTVEPGSGAFGAKHWAHYNGCDPENRSATTPSPCQKHNGCPAATPVTFCLIPGQGHGIWGNAIPVEWAFLRAL